MIAKSGSIIENPEMKWFLHAWISRPAEFRLCMCGGTSWKSILYFFTASFMSLEHSLSII